MTDQSETTILEVVRRFWGFDGLRPLQLQAIQAGVEHRDSLVVMRPQTGELLALVGGRDYARSQFDRCTQAHRQTGSVFKPFAYVAALEPANGGPHITLASFLDDTPLEVKTPSGPWRTIQPGC